MRFRGLFSAICALQFSPLFLKFRDLTLFIPLFFSFSIITYLPPPNLTNSSFFIHPHTWSSSTGLLKVPSNGIASERLTTNIWSGIYAVYFDYRRCFIFSSLWQGFMLGFPVLRGLMCVWLCMLLEFPIASFSNGFKIKKLHCCWHMDFRKLTHGNWHVTGGFKKPDISPWRLWSMRDYGNSRHWLVYTEHDRET